jgi:hypothetical protein
MNKAHQGRGAIKGMEFAQLAQVHVRTTTENMMRGLKPPGNEELGAVLRELRTPR